MGFFTEFNHHDVAADLDIATWDSYPLGFTQNFFLTAAEKVRWARTGHPDIPAFHHDLYRGMCADGRWWVMEQQPGPVNWAQWNPAPLDGMVRLWTWQAFAHGAEVVSYFRWRQAPFAQEQMHTGLHRPDRSLDQGGIEATQVSQELRALAAQIAHPSPDLATGAAHLRVHAPVALVFDYESLWMSQIQPQGADYNALELSFRIYSVLRGLGLDVDIVSPHAPLGGYRLVVLPAQWQVPTPLLQELTQSTAHIVLGPRAGSKTPDLQVPQNLAPGPLQALAGLQVQRVASLPPGMQETVRWTDPTTEPDTLATRWREDWLLQGAEDEAQFDDGRAAVARLGRTRSVAAWLDDAGWRRLLKLSAHDAGLNTLDLPESLRVSRIGALTLVCNFSNQVTHFVPPDPGQVLLGAAELAPCDVAIWRN
jgi:beta-galactosidase